MRFTVRTTVFELRPAKVGKQSGKCFTAGSIFANSVAFCRWQARSAAASITVPEILIGGKVICSRQIYSLLIAPTHARAWVFLSVSLSFYAVLLNGRVEQLSPFGQALQDKSLGAFSVRLRCKRHGTCCPYARCHMSEMAVVAGSAVPAAVPATCLNPIH